jgi:hypothetical protein
MCDWCDRSPVVLEWSSEEVVVPYKWIDGNYHRYFIDFWMKMKQSGDAPPKEYLVEVKPLAQTKPPKAPKTIKGYRANRARLLEWAQNQAKWKAAREFAQASGREFRLLTEVELRKMRIIS